MKGQLGSPEIAATPPPRSPRAAAVAGRGAAGSRSKQTLKRWPSPWGRGVLPLIRESGGNRSQSRTGPRPRPASARTLGWAQIFLSRGP